MQKQLRALFYGQVQGVGFRYTAQSLARHYAVSGYVRNLVDGSVELVAEGEEKELAEFLKRIRKSHLSVYIRDTKELWSEPEGRFQSFTIAV